MLRLVIAVCLLSVSVAPTRSEAQSKPVVRKAALITSSSAPSPATTSEARLPVRRVVLYKNGVGYFEHTGQVRGSQDVSIDFTTGQLNDVVKSLTVLDMGQGASQGRISGVRYNSTAPLSERLKNLRLPVGQETTLASFLAALRGARVEVRSGAVTAAGRLLSVDERQITKDGAAVTTVTEASVVTDSGEMRVFQVTPATSIRVLEHDLNMEVGKYMGLIASTRERDIRRMTISADGTGERPLFVSYISEVPIWKSTYRIVLPSDPKAKPFLQGWAIVDNTVGEDWKDVQLSLVAGAPQSFIQQISQPYYARRPQVAMPEAFELTPQTHEETMEVANASPVMAPPPPASGVVGGIGTGSGRGLGPGSGGGYGGGIFDSGRSARANEVAGIVKDSSGAVVPNARVAIINNATGIAQNTYSDSLGHYSVQGLAPGIYTVAVTASGFQESKTSNVAVSSAAGANLSNQLNVGASAEMVEVTADATSVETSSSLVESEAEGKDLGDLFEYDLKQRVTIGKNQSALVPIVAAKIEAEKISLWNEEHPRALRAIWFNNISGQSLDAGTFNILDNNTFAGEGVMGVIKPGEKRILSYAVDQGIHVDADSENESEKVTRVRIIHGLMTQTSGRREKKVYKVRNADSDGRTIVIEHPLREGWKLVSDAKPVESTASYYRFKLPVEPSKTAELVVEEFEPQETKVALGGITDEQIALFVKQRSISPQMEEALKNVTAQKKVIAGVDNQLQQRAREQSEISLDQQRVRENMKALKGTAEEKQLTQRYASQLNQQEDRLVVLRKEMADLQAQREGLQSKLYQSIEDISFDVTL